MLSQTLTEPKRRMKPTSVVYWMRVSLAIVAAFTEAALHINVTTLGDFAQIIGIGLGAAFYLLSVLIVRHVLRYDATKLKGNNRDVTFGGGTFIMIWIMMTVLLNTLIVAR